MAIRKTVLAPKRSDTQDDMGKNTVRLKRYVVKANFKATGFVPKSAAMAGKEVAITVPSMFSMNKAEATTKGRMREVEAMFGQDVAE